MLLGHPERSEAKSKDPEALPLSFRGGIPRLSLGMTANEALCLLTRALLRVKLLERFDQIPRQWAHPIENTLGNWFRR